MPVFSLPLFLPVALAGIALAAVLRHRIARRLRSSEGAALVLVASLGLIAGATLTPLWSGVGSAPPTGTCDVSRIWLAPLQVYLQFDDPGLNVLLFVPLGGAIAGLRPGRAKLVLAFGGFLLPLAIELTQLGLPILHRACESGDIVDNGAGFVIGFLAATLLKVAGPTPPEGRPSSSGQA